MSDPKLSPWPWEIEWPRFDNRGTLIKDSNGNILAFIGNYERNVANARIMKKAPDLYYCLHEAVVEMCSRMGGDPCPHSADNYDRCSAPDGECFVQRWIKALAQARGEVRK